MEELRDGLQPHGHPSLSCRTADHYVTVKEKTTNCKNILQQRYEGLKADSIGGAALQGHLEAS